MSNLEFGKPSGIYSFDLAVMVAGESNANVIPNFYLNSQICRIKRKTTGGVVGTPYVAQITPAANALNSTVVVKSSSATDTSVYTISWVNTSDPAYWN